MDIKLTRYHIDGYVWKRYFNLITNKDEYEALKPYVYIDPFSCGERVFIAEEKLHLFMRETGVKVMTGCKPMEVYDEDVNFALQQEYDKTIIEVFVE